MTSIDLWNIRDWKESEAFFCEFLFPSLKGFHLTLAKHGPQRSEEGWKLSDLEWIGRLENKVDAGKLSREEADEMLQDENLGV